MTDITLDTDIEVLCGSNKKLLVALRRVGIDTFRDLIFYWPNKEKFHVLRQGESASLAEPGEKVAFNATVENYEWTRGTSRLAGTMKLSDEGGNLWHVPLFGPSFKRWLPKKYPVGSDLHISGKADVYGNKMQVKSYKLSDPTGGVTSSNSSIVENTYNKVGAVEADHIKRLMRKALTMLGVMSDFLPEALIEKYDLMSFDESVRAVHLGASEEVVEKAQERLIFDELLLLQFAISRNRALIKNTNKGIVNAPKTGGAHQMWLSSLPYTLTADQLSAMSEIDRDMSSETPMHRLIQGDVGTGKTLVALHSMLRAVDAGRQAAMMVPTQVLVEQHFSSIYPLIQNVLVGPNQRLLRVATMTSAMKTKDKKLVLAGLKNGEIDILIGTHAMIEDEVEFADLGVVVIDEQHRFGVEHRRKLAAKRVSGDHPDFLVMTATPIPRSLALTLYGDLAVSIMKNRPGLKDLRVITTVITKNSPRRERVYNFVREEIKKGHLAYVVCPLIEPKMDDSGNITGLAEEGVASVIVEAERLADIFPDVTIGVLHGNMSADDREQVMERFRAGEIQLLVATTVIEVGVSVDESTVMIVEDAQRFGLSQLHQLRGRLFRGLPENHCILFCKGDPENYPRLQVMERTTDGFVLAEEDLKLRKEGAVFGSTQSGKTELAFADLQDNIDIVAATRKEVNAILDQDPRLEEHQTLAREIKMRHPEELFFLADAG